MKKYGLTIVCVICLISVFAQKKLNIFQTDSPVLGVTVSLVDSLKFSDDETKLNIHQTDQSVTSLTVGNIDSITIDKTYSLPTIETVSAVYSNTTKKATCVGKVISNGGCALTEEGVCWSKTTTPTINDNKYARTSIVTQFFALMSDLTANETYYVRAYATNCMGTAYGKAIKIQTFTGNVTYTLASSVAAADTDSTVYKLIKTAMDSACWYYNRHTTFSGNIWVYYNAGIPTAQASYHGSIGFGPNKTYMWVGTAMHEIAHFMGSGTTTNWQNLMVSNVWKGATASSLLKTATGETLKGDLMHFWPYGINYKSEITALGNQTAQANGLILHAKIVQAMCVNDAGLPASW